MAIKIPTLSVQWMLKKRDKDIKFVSVICNEWNGTPLMRYVHSSRARIMMICNLLYYFTFPPCLSHLPFRCVWGICEPCDVSQFLTMLRSWFAVHSCSTSAFGWFTVTSLLQEFYMWYRVILGCCNSKGFVGLKEFVL